MQALRTGHRDWKDRSVYVRKEVVNVYPDTLCWIHDYVYSFNDPMTEKYFGILLMTIILLSE